MLRRCRGCISYDPASATSDKCLRGVGVLLRFICIILELKASASSPFAGPRPTRRGVIVPGDVNDLHFNWAAGSGGKRKKRAKKREAY